MILHLFHNTFSEDDQAREGKHSKCGTWGDAEFPHQESLGAAQKPQVQGVRRDVEATQGHVLDFHKPYNWPEREIIIYLLRGKNPQLQLAVLSVS